MLTFLVRACRYVNLFCRRIFVQVQESGPAEIRGLQVMSMPCIHSYPLTVITGNVYLTQYVLIIHVIFSFLPFAFSTLYLYMPDIVFQQIYMYDVVFQQIYMYDVVFQQIYMYDVLFQQIYMYKYHVQTHAKSIRSQWRCCLCWRQLLLTV